MVCRAQIHRATLKGDLDEGKKQAQLKSAIESLEWLENRMRHLVEDDEMSEKEKEKMRPSYGRFLRISGTTNGKEEA